MSSLLEQLVYPTSIETFLRSVYGRTFGYYPGHLTTFSDIIDWPTISRMVTSQYKDDRVVRIVRAGTPVPRQRYTSEQQGQQILHLSAMIDELSGERALIIEDVEMLHEPVTKLVMALERELRESIGAQIFASGPHYSGFGAHWDPYDVIVLQVLGSKVWTLYEPSRPDPLMLDIAEHELDPSRRITTVKMGPGDVLYLPRGWWHDVESSGEASAHITLAVKRRVGVDYLSWLNGELRVEEILRRNIPRFPEEGSPAEYADVVKDIVAKVITAESISRFLEVQDEIARPHLMLDLPNVFSRDRTYPETARVLLLTSRPRIVRSDDRHIEFRADGKVFKFRNEVLEPLTLLCESAECTVGELERCSAISATEIQELLNILEDHGLLSHVSTTAND